MLSLLLAVITCVCYASPTPYTLRRTPQDYTPIAPTSNQIQGDLGQQISSNSSIFFPNSPEYRNATSRWNVYGQPNIAVVVEPATPEDVAVTVRYANHVNLPFLAVNRGHGGPDTLATIQNGIEIWMSNFDQVDIAEDGQTARVGGGVDVQGAIDAFDARGKASATGSCACVGLLGAGLGGGHGRTQGFHGLIADNIVSAQVVIANGSLITVNDTSYPDLFWGLRGAGHNFGIVTTVQYRLYERPAESWFYANYRYNGSQLEALFELLNTQHDEEVPPQMASRVLSFVWNSNVSTSEPVIYLDFEYAGSESEAAPLLEPFTALGPSDVTTGNVPYPQLADQTGTGVESPLCAHGLQRMDFAVELETYNVTAVRASFDAYTNLMRAIPEIQSTSSLVFENYALNAFQAVPAESTAYPHRYVNHQTLLIIGYAPGQAVDSDVIEGGERIRGALQDGTGSPRPDTYLNYAFGNEELGSVYGWEDWRLERLRGLKRTYDPENRFSGYMPIS